ncbi:hypothetical protein D9M72_475420 [compost metagenome]
MDDHRFGFPGGLGAADLPDGNQCRNGRRRHWPSVLVDHEAAVGVAVEGQAQVGAVGDDGGLQVAEVLRLEGVGRMVGERPVELEVQRHNSERQSRVELVPKDRGNGQARHAVAGVHHHLQRPDGIQGHERAELSGVTREHVKRGHGALGRGCGDPAVDILLGQIPYGREPGFCGNRYGAGLGHLDPVVFRGVMAGGENGPGYVQCAAHVVKLIGGDKAQGLHVRTAPGSARRKGAAKTG